MKKNTNWQRKIKIQERFVGDGEPVFIVAEAGVAHFGSMEKALRLVDLAVESKADAIKFQIYHTDSLISGDSAEWKERFLSKELPFEAFRKIKSYCDKKGIIFFATAHDEPSLDFLGTLNVPVYKIGSGEVQNWSFLERIASLNKPVFLSTGMYEFDDIDKALSVFENAGNHLVAVLHCVTSYPASPRDVNLKVLATIREKFNCIVGYSDHTEGIHFPVSAVALGAKIIEKHISLDFHIQGAQDWKVSCGEKDLSELVRQIREIEAGIGNGLKKLCFSEIQNLKWARKSLVAVADIRAGEVILPDMIQIKRPGHGIPPSEMESLLGKKARKDIQKDSVIVWEDIDE
ncbi:MAG: N-acetylneuraminate synthase family protein [Desulfobacterales bacterium]